MTGVAVAEVETEVETGIEIEGVEAGVAVGVEVAFATEAENAFESEAVVELEAAIGFAVALEADGGVGAESGAGLGVDGGIESEIESPYYSLRRSELPYSSESWILRKKTYLSFVLLSRFPDCETYFLSLMLLCHYLHYPFWLDCFGP